MWQCKTLPPSANAIAIAAAVAACLPLWNKSTENWKLSNLLMVYSSSMLKFEARIRRFNKSTKVLYFSALLNGSVDVYKYKFIYGPFVQFIFFSLPQLPNCSLSLFRCSHIPLSCHFSCMWTSKSQINCILDTIESIIGSEFNSKYKWLQSYFSLVHWR